MKTEEAARGTDLIPGCLPDKGWQFLSLCNVVPWCRYTHWKLWSLWTEKTEWHTPENSHFLCPLGWWTIPLQGDFKIQRKPTQTWYLVLFPSQKKKRYLKGHLMEVYVIPLTKWLKQIITVIMKVWGEKVPMLCKRLKCKLFKGEILTEKRAMEGTQNLRSA